MNPIPTLYTHGCSDVGIHECYDRLRPRLRDKGIDLLCDPFGPGDQVVARIKTIPFEALIYMLTPKSWASVYCQAEFNAARDRRSPVFFVRLAGEVPASCMPWLVVEASRILSDETQNANFAESVRARVQFQRLMRAIVHSIDPDEALIAAQSLFDDSEPTVIEEQALVLEKLYGSLDNSTIRYWLIETLEKVHSPTSRDIFQRLAGIESHPLPANALRDHLAGYQLIEPEELEPKRCVCDP